MQCYRVLQWRLNPLSQGEFLGPERRKRYILDAHSQDNTMVGTLYTVVIYDFFLLRTFRMINADPINESVPVTHGVKAMIVLCATVKVLLIVNLCCGW